MDVQGGVFVLLLKIMQQFCFSYQFVNRYMLIYNGEFNNFHPIFITGISQCFQVLDLAKIA